MDEPRAYTADEVRDMLLDAIRAKVEYWASLPDVTPATEYTPERQMTVRDRVEGVAFSILVMLDGHSMALPAVTLKLGPHPDDKEFHRSAGENWFEPGTEIPGLLHDHFYNKPA